MAVLATLSAGGHVSVAVNFRPRHHIVTTLGTNPEHGLAAPIKIINQLIHQARIFSHIILSLIPGTMK